MQHVGGHGPGPVAKIRLFFSGMLHICTMMRVRNQLARRPDARCHVERLGNANIE
jgi:hypothetical protein